MNTNTLKNCKLALLATVATAGLALAPVAEVYAGTKYWLLEIKPKAQPEEVFVACISSSQPTRPKVIKNPRNYVIGVCPNYTEIQ